MYRSHPPVVFATTRRRFVQGLAGSALTLASARYLNRAQAAQPGTVLSGTEFNLEIGALEVNFTGAPRMATVVNGQLPAPGSGVDPAIRANGESGARRGWRGQ